jgi:hypothetical protein
VIYALAVYGGKPKLGSKIRFCIRPPAASSTAVTAEQSEPQDHEEDRWVLL